MSRLRPLRTLLSLRRQPKDNHVRIRVPNREKEIMRLRLSRIILSRRLLLHPRVMIMEMVSRLNRARRSGYRLERGC